MFIEVRTEDVIFARYLDSLLSEAGYKTAVGADELSKTGREWERETENPSLIICSPEMLKTAETESMAELYCPVLAIGYRDEFGFRPSMDNTSQKRENVQFLYRPFLDEKLLEAVSDLLAQKIKTKTPQGAENADKEKPGTSGTVKREKLVLNKAKRTASLGGKKVHFSESEYLLLELLAEKRGENVTYSEIAEKVWNKKDMASNNLTVVYIGYLRNKLFSLSEKPFIFSVRGIGYRMRTEI